MPLMIQKVNEQMLICLLDSGSSDMIFRHAKLPMNFVPKVLQSPIYSNMIIGQKEIKTYVELQDNILPEFSYSWKIEKFKAYVIYSKCCNYDQVNDMLKIKL